MDERFGGGHTGLAAAPLCHDLVVLAPDPLAVLADVCEERRLFLIEHRGDVDIRIWKEALGLAAAVHLEEVEARCPQVHPGPDREDARHLMIHVRVDGPMDE